jgi:glycosyltransferase involved in cell wall biosynthesis
MNHIIIDARESGTTTGRYIDKLVEYLHVLLAGEAGDKITYKVSLLAKPHRLDYYREVAPQFEAIACPHQEFSFAEQIGLKQQIEGLKPDLVHFPAVQQPVWLDRAIPVVTTMQDLTTLRFKNPAKNPLVFTAKQQVYRWVNQRVAHKSTALITPTEFVKQDIIAFSGVSPDKITVTLESADDLPKPAIPYDNLVGQRFLVYVGRPTPHKNLERLITAFALLKDRQPDLQLVLVGKTDANYDRIKQSVQEQGIAKVLFAGFIEDKQLRWMYENCQAYAFPSLSEGFGLPALEAMRHGAPVVSSNATCSPEVYGDAALYFDPLSVEDMANKFNIMLSDKALRQDFITKGYAQAAKYSWQRMAEQTLGVYEKVLGQ